MISVLGTVTVLGVRFVVSVLQYWSCDGRPWGDIRGNVVERQFAENEFGILYRLICDWCPTHPLPALIRVAGFFLVGRRCVMRTVALKQSLGYLVFEICGIAPQYLAIVRKLHFWLKLVATSQIRAMCTWSFVTYLKVIVFDCAQISIEHAMCVGCWSSQFLSLSYRLVCSKLLIALWNLPVLCVKIPTVDSKLDGWK